MELIKQNQEDKYPYLSKTKIPILKKINEMQQPDSEFLEDPRGRLNLFLSVLFEDSNAYIITRLVQSFGFDIFDIQETGFFGFYELAKKWLADVQKKNQPSQNEVNLEHPYELAKQLFVEYVNFRKNAKNGAKYKNGCNNKDGSYQPNIYDLFTDEDLVQLGGTEFIKDCYQQIGIEFNEDIAQEHGIKKKPQIQNIDSRTGDALKSDEDVKPNLYKRVDKYLSWKIFKDGKVQNLTNDEVSILKEAMKNEGFWKHLGKTESKILPFTGGAALILGLIAAFPFGATGGALLALILTPIGAGALVIAPSVTPISQRSAIVDNMIEIGNKNKEFSDKLKQGEEQYKQYKQDHPDFLKPESEKGKDIKEKEEEIGSLQENKIIPKNYEQNEQNKQNHPLEKVNETNQNQNNQGNGKEENKEGNEEP